MHIEQGALGTRTHLSPHRGAFDWRLRQLWQYRDLIRLFVWRDFVAVYKQTILGPAWHFVQPLMTTLVFTIVFGRVAALPTDGIPPFLFYMAGYVAWTFFATCFDNISKAFVGNAQLLSKVYFHRLAIPISLVLSSLIAFAIQFGVFLLTLITFVVGGTSAQVTGWVLVTPVLVLMLGGYGFGTGLLVCALTTRYRDLRHAVTFGVQLLMYLTPVLYPTSSIPGRLQWIAHANPLTPVVEAFRLAFLGAGSVTPGQLAGSFAIMVALIVLSLVLFTRAERTFMDTV